VLSSGIVLSGGGALIKGIDEVIEAATGIRTRIADKPTECVCIGAGFALSNPTVVRRSEVSRKR
ncbi:MAG: rod shape-determining protein, partial [Clostridia bacterium]|nr:rod shape-determining protein [Clostridia bacterium]